jgi:hypothetical protein
MLKDLQPVLRAQQVLLIADGLENVLPGGDHQLELTVRNQLWDVLLQLRDSGVGVVITSFDIGFDCQQLAKGKKVAYLQMDGLRAEDAHKWANSILGKERKRISYEELSDLLAYLGYHPLAIQLVLPKLAEISLRKIRINFVQELPNFADNDATTHYHKSLLALLEYSCKRLNHEEQNLLSRLTIFENCASEEILLDIVRLTGTQWNKLKEALKRVNLLSVKQVHEKAFLHFHPMLIPYLCYSKRLSNVIEEEVLLEHYVQRYYEQALLWYDRNVCERRSVQLWVRQELPNLMHTVELLLKADELKMAEKMTGAICWFLKKFDSEKDFYDTRNYNWDCEKLREQKEAFILAQSQQKEIP